MIDQKQEYLRKVHILTEDKTHQVKEEFESFMEQSRHSTPAVLASYNVTESNDEFYDAYDEIVAYDEEE